MFEYSKRKCKSIRKIIKQNLRSIIGRSWQFGHGNFIGPGELKGAVPDKIEPLIRGIGILRYRDNTYGDYLLVGLSTGQEIKVKLTETERKMCSAHYAYLSLKSMLDHVAAGDEFWVRYYEDTCRTHRLKYRSNFC